MWTANHWKDYEVIDTSGGEKLERWGKYILVRPDPQVIWNTPKTQKGWKKMNGHYHRSGLDIIDKVPRLDVNSATFNWIPNPHDLFPAEWYKKYECVGNMVIYADPLSTVVTIDSDSGEMTFEGVESSFVCDVSTEKSGNSSGYRLCKPENISAKINYKNL